MASLFRNIKKWWKRSKYLGKTMNQPTITRKTCLHEAGHYLMAYMFQTNFILQFITVDKALMDKSWNGGFKFKGAPGARNTPDFNDQFALIAISGICVDTISFHGAPFVEQNLYTFPNDASMIQAQGGDVDYDLFKLRIQTVSFYFGLNPVRTQWNAFLFAFNFFLDANVWNAVEEIADMLLSSDNYSLQHEQIESHLKNQPYYSALQLKKIEIDAERYPLTKERLILSV